LKSRHFAHIACVCGWIEFIDMPSCFGFFSAQCYYGDYYESV
jgi:hypothetical protein